MNISWCEVALGFMAITWIGLEDVFLGIGINHSSPVQILGVGAAIYGVVKGTYSWQQWWKGADRHD